MNLTPTMIPSQTMLLLTYTPRADAETRGYENWLRQVDNPFFNSRPGILHYTNWKIVEPKVGEIPFTHFDTMFIRDADAYAEAFEDPEVQRFADRWVELWGVDSAAGHNPVNYRVFLTEAIASPIEGGRRTDVALFLPNTPREDARQRGYDDWLRQVDNPFFNRQPGVAGYTNWRVIEGKIGDVEFTDFDLIYVDGHDAFERLFINNAEGAEFAHQWVEQWGSNPSAANLTSGTNFSACVAEVIASPDLTVDDERAPRPG